MNAQAEEYKAAMDKARKETDEEKELEDKKQAE